MNREVRVHVILSTLTSFGFVKTSQENDGDLRPGNDKSKSAAGFILSSVLSTTVREKERTLREFKQVGFVTGTINHAGSQEGRRAYISVGLK